MKKRQTVKRRYKKKKKNTKKIIKGGNGPGYLMKNTYREDNHYLNANEALRYYDEKTIHGTTPQKFYNYSNRLSTKKVRELEAKEQPLSQQNQKTLDLYKKSLETSKWKKGKLLKYNKNTERVPYWKTGSWRNTPTYIPKSLKNNFNALGSLKKLKSKSKNNRINNFDLDDDIGHVAYQLGITRFPPSYETNIAKEGLDYDDLDEMINEINKQIGEDSKKNHIVFGFNNIYILYSKEMDKLIILMGEYHDSNQLKDMEKYKKNKYFTNLKYVLQYVTTYLDSLFRKNKDSGKEFDFYFEDYTMHEHIRRSASERSTKYKSKRRGNLINIYERFNYKENVQKEGSGELTFDEINKTFSECFKKNKPMLSRCDELYGKTRFQKFNFRHLFLADKNSKPFDCLGVQLSKDFGYRTPYIKFISIDKETNEIKIDIGSCHSILNHFNTFGRCLKNKRIYQDNQIIIKLQDIVNRTIEILDICGSRYNENLNELYSRLDVDKLNELLKEIKSVLGPILVHLKDYEENINYDFKKKCNKTIDELVKEKHKYSHIFLLLKVCYIMYQFFEHHMIDLYLLSRTTKEYQKRIIVYGGDAHIQVEKSLLLSDNYGSFKLIYSDNILNSIINYVLIPKEITLHKGKTIQL